MNRGPWEEGREGVGDIEIMGGRKERTYEGKDNLSISGPSLGANSAHKVQVEAVRTSFTLL